MLVLNIITIIIFIALGVLFANGKGANLVAGFNTMSKEDKEKVDTKVLCKYMSVLMFIIAGCWCVYTVGFELALSWLIWLGQGLLLAVIVIFLIIMNTGNRISKK